MRRTLVALLLALPFVAVFACKDEPGRSTACSTGPARTTDPRFSDHYQFTGKEPECVPRCGPNRVFDDAGRSSNLPALPSGACELEDESCVATLASFCSVHGVVCQCRNGEWDCFVHSMGAGICPPPMVDASGDG